MSVSVSFYSVYIYTERDLLLHQKKQRESKSVLFAFAVPELRVTSNKRSTRGHTDCQPRPYGLWIVARRQSSGVSHYVGVIFSQQRRSSSSSKSLQNRYFVFSWKERQVVPPGSILGIYICSNYNKPGHTFLKLFCTTLLPYSSIYLAMYLSIDEQARLHSRTFVLFFIFFSSFFIDILVLCWHLCQTVG